MAWTVEPVWEIFMNLVSYRLICHTIIVVTSMGVVVANLEEILSANGFIVTMLGPYLLQVALYEIAIAHEPDSVPRRAWWFLMIGVPLGLQIFVSMQLWYDLKRNKSGDRPFLGGCIAFLSVLVLFILVTEFGVEELHYILTLPGKLPNAAWLAIRTGPRALLRYYMVRGSVEGSVLTWWVNDQLERIMMSQ